VPLAPANVLAHPGAQRAGIRFRPRRLLDQVLQGRHQPGQLGDVHLGELVDPRAPSGVSRSRTTRASGFRSRASTVTDGTGLRAVLGLIALTGSVTATASAALTILIGWLVATDGGDASLRRTVLGGPAVVLSRGSCHRARASPRTPAVDSGGALKAIRAGFSTR
jgi:hypothetical protein